MGTKPINTHFSESVHFRWFVSSEHEQSKTPKRQEIANDQKKTVNRDKIARELLAERDKQKEQKQKLRDEKGSQLKNKFGKDNSWKKCL